jgi:hypothetical protein
VTMSYLGLIYSLALFVLMCCIKLVMPFVGKRMVHKLA